MHQISGFGRFVPAGLSIIGLLLLGLIAVACTGEDPILPAQTEPTADPTATPIAEPSQEPEPTNARGAVGGVDVVAGRVTVALETGGAVALSVDGNTEVTRDGEPVDLESIALGDGVRVSYDPRSLLALGVHVEGGADRRSATGTIQEVRGTLGLIDIAVDGGTATFSLGAGAVIIANGFQAGLADLVAGSTVSFEYDADSMAVQSMTVTSIGNGPEGSSETMFTGRVRVVLMGPGIVVVMPDTDRETTILTGEETDIFVDGVRGGITSLYAGARVVVEYDPETKVASYILVSEPPRDWAEVTTASSNGVIEAYDDAISVLTLLVSKEGEMLSVRVTGRTEITLDGATSTTDDLAVGMDVTVMYRQDLLEALTIVTVPEEDDQEPLGPNEGIVERINARAGRLEVAFGNDVDLDIIIMSDTEVTINGYPNDIHGFLPGDRITVHYDPETFVAASISATISTAAGG